MEYIYGKLNKEVELAEYRGISTDTAIVTVDNSDHTIQVEILGGGSSVKGNFLPYDKEIKLADYELETLYKNLKLANYLDTNAIIKEKEQQTLVGNLDINGKLSAKGILNLDSSKSNGIKFNNYTTDTSAKIYITKDGQLRYVSNTNNAATDFQVLTSGALITNMFTYYNGSSLASRHILPSDIYTNNYGIADITESRQITTKEYVDKATRRNTNYGIVSSYTDFSKVTA